MTTIHLAINYPRLYRYVVSPAQRIAGHVACLVGRHAWRVPRRHRDAHCYRCGVYRPMFRTMRQQALIVAIVTAVTTSVILIVLFGPMRCFGWFDKHLTTKTYNQTEDTQNKDR